MTPLLELGFTFYGHRRVMPGETASLMIYKRISGGRGLVEVLACARRSILDMWRWLSLYNRGTNGQFAGIVRLSNEHSILVRIASSTRWLVQNQVDYELRKHAVIGLEAKQSFGLSTADTFKYRIIISKSAAVPTVVEVWI